MELRVAFLPDSDSNAEDSRPLVRWTESTGTLLELLDPAMLEIRSRASVVLTNKVLPFP